MMAKEFTQRERLGVQGKKGQHAEEGDIPVDSDRLPAGPACDPVLPHLPPSPASDPWGLAGESWLCIRRNPGCLAGSWPALDWRGRRQVRDGRRGWGELLVPSRVLSVCSAW